MNNNQKTLKQAITALFLLAAMTCAHALDTPHNPTVFNNCVNCHDMSSMNAQLLRVDNPHPPENIDDTIFNNLCWSCHNGVIAPFKKTHSSLTTDNGYGNWAMECRTCHNPHSQVQTTAYFESSYMASGTSTGLTTTTLTQTGAGWTTDEHAGRLLIPNTSQFNVNYRILGNTSDTLTLGSLVDLARAAVGDTFAIIYGKLIKHEVNTPNSGTKPVRFFQSTGANSFGDGNATLDGICEVCHTQTNHFRNNGAAPDQGHSNVGGAAGQKCTESCHLHSDGFAHGGGGGGGLCITCHGHEPGTLYDPDLTAPHTAGAVASQGKGTVAPHSTHTEAAIVTDTDDKRGPPGVYCDTCHNVNAMPSFKSGTDANGDGKFNLAETDVCNTCHSSGGAYDGVNDAVIGAKNNWHSGGVYAADGTLKPGKEKWCVGCHDTGSSVINTRQAPDVGGDGINYGFYSSGHGSKGQECKDCHEQTTSHNFDGQKTYRAASNNYQLGYRLKSVSGQPPMNIPLDAADGYTAAGCFNGTFNIGNYRLCLTCHESYGANTMGTAQNLLSDSRPAGGRGCSDNPYKAAPQTITGFRNESASGFTFGMSTNPLPGNGHWDHLVDIHAVSWNLLWRSDDTGTPNSRVSCPTCHNPHGDSYGADTPTIRMTNTVFQLEWGNNATGDYGVLGATGDINTRCTVSCHFSSDPSVYKYYRAHTSPFLTAIALADINGTDPLSAEAGYTNDRTAGVSFSLGGAVPTQMQCAEDISFTVNATGWIPYTGPNYNYTLSDSDGNKNVSCQLRNAQGSSHIKTVSIVLDRQGPAWTANALSSPNGGESWLQASSQTITWDTAGVSDANLKAGDILSLEYSTDGGVSFPNSIATSQANDGIHAWTVPVVDSTTARVRVSAYDKAGNRGSDASNANFTIAPIAPELVSVSVIDANGADPQPADAGYTNSQTVTVLLGTTNSPTQMMLAEDAGFTVNPTGWITFDADYSYSLSAGDGAKAVHVKVRNSAGESAAQNTAIVLDTVAPAMQASTLTAPNGGEFWSATSTENITWNSGHITDANLGVSPIKLAYSSNGGTSYDTWSGWEANDGSYAWTLPSTTSYQGRVKVVAYDKAGNIAEDASNAVFLVSPPVSYIVTTTADSGAGSLRQVMTDLVVAGGNSTIWFNIPSGMLTNGVALINFATDLPTLSAANITIDGASQTAIVGNTNPNGPEVVLDGPCASGTFECITTYGATVAFNITAAGVAIKDMQIANVGTAIRSTVADTVIRGNHLGYSSDTTGFTTKKNLYNISLSGANAIVGGDAAGDRNYIAGAFYNGISLSAASGAQIVNNAIGLHSNDTLASNNTWTAGASVYFNNTSNGQVRNNIFAGSSNGLEFAGTSSTNVVKGNTFGVYYKNGVWTSIGGQSTAGVYLNSASANGNVIGGPTVATSDASLNDSNVFDPAAGATGIYIYDAVDYTTKIFGNFIGTNPEQDEVFSGGTGILARYLWGVTIGGADAGEAGNIIANMTSYGFMVYGDGSSTKYIELSRNSFYNNGDNALDDAIYLSTSGNSTITRPGISTAATTNVTVTGVSGGNGGTQLGDVVEVYIAAYGGTEYGEGKTFVGSAQVPNGSTSIVVPVSGVSSGQRVTATRTNVYSSGPRQTSAFSSNFLVP